MMMMACCIVNGRTTEASSEYKKEDGEDNDKERGLDNENMPLADSSATPIVSPRDIDSASMTMQAKAGTMINTVGTATVGAMNAGVEMTSNAVMNAAHSVVNEEATMAIHKFVDGSFAHKMANATDE